MYINILINIGNYKVRQNINKYKNLYKYIIININKDLSTKNTE